MKLKSSRDAEELEKKNHSMLRALIKKYQDPNTPPEELARLKEKFKQILGHIDGCQKPPATLMDIVTGRHGKVNRNGSA